MGLARSLVRHYVTLTDFSLVFTKNINFFSGGSPMRIGGGVGALVSDADAGMVSDADAGMVSDADADAGK